MSRKATVLFAVRTVMAALLLVFIVFLQMGEKDSKTSIEEAARAVTGAINMESMEEGGNRILKKFYGLNAGDYEGVCFYAPTSNMDAQELLIVKLKDDSQSETVAAAVQSRLESQKASFEGYGVEQFALLEKHVLDIRGNYILYIVHPDAQAADRAFADCL
ncbi:MAG: DUF4358 domain-containing protein [Eubacteriales bacterium]|nr:DUF4358 domain-containing protein [Eubacteriales bacterium]